MGPERNGLKRYLVGVAIAVTSAMLIQSGTLIWWCGGMNTRVTYIERDVAANTAAIAAALKIIVNECVPIEPNP